MKVYPGIPQIAKRNLISKQEDIARHRILTSTRFQNQPANTLPNTFDEACSALLLGTSERLCDESSDAIKHAIAKFLHDVNIEIER
tara:strand:+ start:1875 stop:2132 length:258 start_codon:yes stop_codon:yes gene_type:complete